jgi:hypothetical protein
MLRGVGDDPGNERLGGHGAHECSVVVDVALDEEQLNHVAMPAATTSQAIRRRMRGNPGSPSRYLPRPAYSSTSTSSAGLFTPLAQRASGATLAPESAVRISCTTIGDAAGYENKVRSSVLAYVCSDVLEKLFELQALSKIMFTGVTI